MRFPSRGVAPATSFLKKDFLPCGVRTFLFAKQSGRRCNSHFYYIIAPAKMQIVFAFFPHGRCGRTSEATSARTFMPGENRMADGGERPIFRLFSLRRLQSVHPRVTLIKGHIRRNERKRPEPKAQWNLRGMPRCYARFARPTRPPFTYRRSQTANPPRSTSAPTAPGNATSTTETPARIFTRCWNVSHRRSRTAPN